MSILSLQDSSVNETYGSEEESCSSQIEISDNLSYSFQAKTQYPEQEDSSSQDDEVPPSESSASIMPQVY